MRKLGPAFLGSLIALFASVALAATIPSPTGTVILSGSPALITDAAGNTWGINATAPCTATWATKGTTGEVTINGVLDATTCQVTEIAYVNGLVWQENSSAQWFSKATAAATAWSAKVLLSPVPQALLTWGAPTKNIDGSAITLPLTYNIYQGVGTSLLEVQSGLTTLTATLTVGMAAGTTQCFAVTAVESQMESAQSAPGCKAFAAVVAAAPTPSAPSSVVAK